MQLLQAVYDWSLTHSISDHTPDALLYEARDFALDHFNREDRLIFMGAVAQLAFFSDPTNVGWANATSNWPRLFPTGDIPPLWAAKLELARV